MTAKRRREAVSEWPEPEASAPTVERAGVAGRLHRVRWWPVRRVTLADAFDIDPHGYLCDLAAARLFGAPVE